MCNKYLLNYNYKIINLKSAPPLPEPTPEEEFPDDPKTHRLFNQNVLWNFEDLQMLLGTDLPIFGGGTYPCLSLRLRYNVYLFYTEFKIIRIQF